MPKPRPSLLTVAILMLGSASSLSAQGTDAVIAGTVRGADGEPIASATVQVRNESTGFETGVIATQTGDFVIGQLPLGGPYTVTASSIGYRSEQRAGIELGLGDRARVEFGLEETAMPLEAVVVSADAAATRAERAGAATRFSSAEIGSLPAVGRSFANLAGIAPLHSGSGLNIGGHRNTATNVRVDGVSGRRNRLGRTMGAGPYTISLEAIREFEVSTNDYDVTQGRQGGGALNVATKFGTNELSGSFFTYHRNDGLTTRDYAGHPPDEFSLWQWGGSIGGPIVRDKVHFFLAFDRQDHSNPIQLWNVSSPEDEVEYGVAADSLARFLDILQRKYGLDPAEQQVGAFTQRTVGYTAFARLDWQINGKHRLSLRNNFISWDNPRFGGVENGIYENKSSIRSRDNAFLVSLRSSLSPAVLNELNAQLFLLSDKREPNAGYLPRGIVRVRSDLSNGTTGQANLQFGGNRNAPADMPEAQIQLANKTYIQWGGHRITLGTDNLFTSYDIYIQDRQNGLFEFDSLGDLENLSPYRYVRDAPVNTLMPYVRQDVLDFSVFAQTDFEPLPRLSATLGLRYDATVFFQRADHNATIDEAFGMRTDERVPTDWGHLQPRVQLTWDVRGDRSEILRAGGGAFMAQPHHAPFYNNIMASGTNFAEVIVDGDDVPVPDFTSYRDDPATIPGVSAGGGTAPAPVELISPDFRMPRTWKANVAYQRRVLDRLTVGANVLYSRTSNNYHYFLRNLVEEPYFTLANEQDRPVFVPAGTITETGRTNTVNGRIRDDVGTVEALVPAGELRQRAVVLDAHAELPRQAWLSLSYTWNDTRDNSNYQCCLSATAQGTPIAGDPRELRWGQSTWTFRHKVAAYGMLPPVYGFRISGRYVGRSGSPFSLMIGDDINGDGNMVGNNDLAFVFDPDDPATPPDVAESMRHVLENPDNRARDYIRENLGRIAERNGGASPWSSRIDVRLSRSFGTLRGQSVELVVDVFNFANLLNSDWGGEYDLGAKETLLNVRGFDREKQEYVYEVNENVGVTRKSGDPYQIQVGLRYAF